MMLSIPLKNTAAGAVIQSTWATFSTNGIRSLGNGAMARLQQYGPQEA